MATFERHVDVDWKGSVMEGKGEAKAGTGAFSLPVSFPSRIGEPGGKTSPEELMAAAHAACYAMALNGTLGRKKASGGSHAWCARRSLPTRAKPGSRSCRRSSRSRRTG